jgi:hypothetical protein
MLAATRFRERSILTIDVAFYDKLHSLRDVLWGNNRPELRPDKQGKAGYAKLQQPLLLHD